MGDHLSGGKRWRARTLLCADRICAGLTTGRELAGGRMGDDGGLVGITLIGGFVDVVSVGWWPAELGGGEYAQDDSQMTTFTPIKR